MANYTLQHTSAELERAVHEGLLSGYGTCSTAGATVAKIVSDVASSFLLETGAAIHVKFTYKNTAANPTLNVNGTGAKGLRKDASTPISSNNSWEAGKTVQLVYDGTYWIVLDDDVNDIQINGSSVVNNKVVNIVTNSAYNASTNKIATMSDIITSSINMTVENETLKFNTGS